MSLQFPEHEKGKRSNDPKVNKLHKLAKLLKVTIHIDGIAYGNEVETVVPDRVDGWSTEELIQPKMEPKADTPKKAKSSKKKD